MVRWNDSHKMARQPLFVAAIALFIALNSSALAYALPDAAVTGIDVAGRDFSQGDLLRMTVRIENQGSSSLPPVPVSIAIDGEHLAEWRASSDLAPGARAEWELTWSARRGSYVVSATADPLNDIAESNETNNVGFISIGVAEEPEPSPWPAALAGLSASVAAAVIGFAIQRYRASARRRRYLPRRYEGRGQGE